MGNRKAMPLQKTKGHLYAVTNTESKKNAR
jgi:hypothetical protein